jgi:GAF domain-containing protein
VISPELLFDVFVEIADTLVDDFDTVDFLHNLVARIAEMADADAVVLSLSDQRGGLRIAATSPGTSMLGELLDLVPLTDPTNECFATGRAVVDAHLEAFTTDWPEFAALTDAAGFVAVHAFPMRLRDEAVGVVTLLSRQPAGFAELEARIVQALADIATISILQERSLSKAEALAEQLQAALDSRIVIEQAKGVLAQTQGISVDDAFTLMRERARSTRSRLIDVATVIVSSRG